MKTTTNPGAEKTVKQMARRAAKSQARLAEVAKRYPGLAAFWAGSAGASVEASIARGETVVIVAE